MGKTTSRTTSRVCLQTKSSHTVIGQFCIRIICRSCTINVVRSPSTGPFGVNLNCLRINTEILKCPIPLWTDLAGKAEQLGYKSCFGPRVFLCHPSYSSLPNPVHRLDSFQRSSGPRKGFVALGRPDAFFRNTVVLFNELITNDKFCLSLVSSQKLGWVRGPRAGVGGRSGPASHPQGVRPPSGGEHATKVAGSTAMAAEVGCGAAVGSSLPTSLGVDS